MKNKENGITLIALIITIIVMLILVGVTINVAMNGGLIDKAKTAASKTEQEALYEEIIASAEYTNSGEIDVVSTYNAFKEGKEVTLKTTGNLDETTKNIVFTVKGKTGDYTYSITTGKVINGENPWITRGLTAGYIVYDKKYTYNTISGGVKYEFFMELGSDGSGSSRLDATDYVITTVSSAQVDSGEIFEFNVISENCFEVNSAVQFTYGNDGTIEVDGFEGGPYTFSL